LKTMARTPNSSAEVTRGRIVDSALELFATKTYAGTSLQDIAESIGMSKAALYYHFPSKESLLHAMFAPTVQRIERALADATRPDGTVDRVRLVHEVVDAQIEHAVAVRALIGDPSAGAALRDRLGFDRLRAQITAALADLGEPGEIGRLRALCALGAINWSIMMTVVERRTAGPGQWACAADMFSDQDRKVIAAAALDVLGLS
jgi:AcrR family transcriptional regulator